MRIRYSKMRYIFPGLLALMCVIGSITDTSEASGAMLVSGVMIALLCLADYRSAFIEVQNGMVKACVGLIRRKTLSTPVCNINGCEVKKFLCWNRLKITSGLTVYIFKNMADIDAFAAALNAQVSAK